ncbi:hypothetical protein GQ43DRAFT_368387 [Delitschia confertaspora ATCC 74209]|uniref:Uncharacterized protein n=1 Tax=Delitschia confertaspora ATCC 74209 TaxID=1513339 RepID=A0A9P4MU66_9PLEO|nr:hypothetical protein GQ43DRAFT_368387 [Delitschia confertaspora ATCC 74209]
MPSPTEGDIFAGSSYPTTKPTFWSRFHGFEDDPTVGLENVFKRLAIHQGWSTKSKRHHRAEAFEAEFGNRLGTQSTLESWQKLCVIVGIQPVPPSIKKCKKALKGKHVNIVNLINHCRNPDKFSLKKFASYAEFQNYTKRGHIFPKAAAKRNAFLKELLRVIY